MNEKMLLKNHGFTLIELIVVFSAISILSTIGIASFVNYSRSQALQTSATDLVNTLNLAKSRALSQVKPSQCTSQDALSGYQVNVLNNSTYNISVICGGTHTVATITLPTNITFDLAQTTANSVFFPIISSGVQGTGAIDMTAYGQSRCIVVNPGGTIQLLNINCSSR